jgi:hypothetical protein
MKSTRHMEFPVCLTTRTTDLSNSCSKHQQCCTRQLFLHYRMAKGHSPKTPLAAITMWALLWHMLFRPGERDIDDQQWFQSQ